MNATINLYAYCTIEETDDNQITINAYDAHCNKSYPMAESLEIDGEASLIKGVYNRVVKDLALVLNLSRLLLTMTLQQVLVWVHHLLWWFVS